MKQKTKKIIWKVIKIIWFLIGGISMLSGFLLYLGISNAKSLGEIFVLIIFFTDSLIVSSIFVIATFLYLLIKFIIKKLRKKDD